MISALVNCSASACVPPALLRYDDKTDSQIVRMAQRGDCCATEYLLYKYRYLVRIRVSLYFLIGAEREDLLQVGMIGLWQSIKDYRPDRSASFASFAALCVTRHVITAIKSATRGKQMPLNQARSLSSQPCASEPVWRFSDGRPDHLLDPQELILRREANSNLSHKIHQMLSPFEWKVLSGYKSGRSYHEIAIDLRCSPKSVDNALARIRRKVAARSF